MKHQRWDVGVWADNAADPFSREDFDTLRDALRRVVEVMGKSFVCKIGCMGRQNGQEMIFVRLDDGTWTEVS